MEKQKQSIKALSTTEDELVVLVDGYKEQRSVMKVFEETGHVCCPLRVYCDNQAYLDIVQGTGYSGRAKHIDLRYFAIQDLHKSKAIQLLYIPSEKNYARLQDKVITEEQIDEYLEENWYVSVRKGI